MAPDPLPQRTNEAQDGVHKETAGDGQADAMMTMTNGEWSIKLRILPPSRISQQQDGGDQGSGAAVQEMNFSFQGVLRPQEAGDGDAQRQKWFKEMRGWLMVLATVAASVTYQAGLNPPGGFWQEDDKSHRAGDPALHDEHHGRYMLFYYFNATAFVMSLVIMVLLMSERFYHKEAKVFALLLTTFLDLASLIGAYIAGTTRYFSSCIYVIVIACVAFVAVILMGEVLNDICVFVIRIFPCMATLADKNWCPIPKGVKERINKMKEDRKQPAKKAQHNTGSCCQCCAFLVASN